MLNKLISGALLFLVLAQGALSVRCGPSDEICCGTETPGVNHASTWWPVVPCSYLSEMSLRRRLKETYRGAYGDSHVRRSWSCESSISFNSGFDYRWPSVQFIGMISGFGVTLQHMP
ncbi:hypothetical protein FB451DRAFT_1377645 [Mycena latifolia]|nr:hypothetical protein FB451DRAFT_1377645 [Mycena latifolia]